jgi:hypothetical protein
MEGAVMTAPSIEIVVFTKAGGPLTKRISLAADGTIISDGSTCVMSRGTAHRVEIADVEQLAELIERLKPYHAIALGSLRADLSSKVKIVSKAELMNGAAGPDVIARTGADIIYEPGQPAFALLDFDTKGMPPAVAAKLEAAGGFWPALCSVLPALKGVAHLTRLSTSAGLSRSDTGEEFVGSGGLHVYVPVRDGTDIPRFLKALHVRCWLAGLGWMVVGVGGQLLERSIVDRMVGASERLVFEGGPILVPPLQQHRESRRPVAVVGEALDTVAACPPVTVVETSEFAALAAKEEERLASARATSRAAFIKSHTAALVARGFTAAAAEAMIARQCDGTLLSGIILSFDDPALVGTTVGDILDDPVKFEGETLADPLEGRDYGACKAKIMLRADGTPWIHSFAHGRTVYELRYDAATVRAKLEATADNDLVKMLISLTLKAVLSADEYEALRNYAAKRSRAGLRTIDREMKDAREQEKARRKNAQRARQRAARTDPRPQLTVPPDDAPWRPVMDAINSVLSQSSQPIPPTRDIEGVVARMRKRQIPNMHAFTTETANDEEEDEE